MRDLCVISRDAVFARCLELILREVGAHVTVREDAEGVADGAFLLVDADTAEIPRVGDDRMLLLSFDSDSLERGSCPRLARPFRPARLLAVLGLTEDTEGGAILPLPDASALLCGGERIRLTSTEWALFSCLWEAKGAFVAKEQLHRAVWGGQGDAGVVNVYVHYLRQKLEKNGRRYILSSRKEGYALKGGALC